MTTQIKDLNYYLNLDYDIKVVRVEDEDEDEYMYKAYTNDLDSKAFYGVGASKSEALDSFEETRIELIEYYFENNIPINEPSREDDSLPSGKFILRISPMTHKGLIEEAKKNNQSLNSYINSIFDKFTTSYELLKILKEQVKALTMEIPKEQVMIYKLNPSKLEAPNNKKEDEYVEQAANAA